MWILINSFFVRQKIVWDVRKEWFEIIIAGAWVRIFFKLQFLVLRKCNFTSCIQLFRIVCSGTGYFFGIKIISWAFPNRIFSPTLQPRLVVVFLIIIRLNYWKITPGPGTFKPSGSCSLPAIFTDCLVRRGFPSYEPGPGTLPASYFNLFSRPKLYPLFVVIRLLKFLSWSYAPGPTIDDFDIGSLGLLERDQRGSLSLVLELSGL